MIFDKNIPSCFPMKDIIDKKNKQTMKTVSNFFICIFFVNNLIV